MWHPEEKKKKKGKGKKKKTSLPPHRFKTKKALVESFFQKAVTLKASNNQKSARERKGKEKETNKKHKKKELNKAQEKGKSL
jgi:hypothetical protein